MVIDQIEDADAITTDGQMHAALMRVIELVRQCPHPRSPAGQALLRLSRIINDAERLADCADVKALIDTGKFTVNFYGSTDSGPYAFGSTDSGPYVAACYGCGRINSFPVPVERAICPECRSRPGIN
jgi:hypothetical protein